MQRSRRGSSCLVGTLLTHPRSNTGRWRSCWSRFCCLSVGCWCIDFWRFCRGFAHWCTRRYLNREARKWDRYCSSLTGWFVQARQQRTTNNRWSSRCCWDSRRVHRLKQTFYRWLVSCPPWIRSALGNHPLPSSAAWKLKRPQLNLFGPICSSIGAPIQPVKYHSST